MKTIITFILFFAFVSYTQAQDTDLDRYKKKANKKETKKQKKEDKRQHSYYSDSLKVAEKEAKKEEKSHYKYYSDSLKIVEKEQELYYEYRSDSLKFVEKEEKKKEKDNIDHTEDINLFSKRGKEPKFDFYGSFDLSYQELNAPDLDNNQSLTVGLTLAAVINRNFALGIYGFTNSENLYNPVLESNLRYAAGGMFLELRILQKIPLHVTIPLRAGFGTISYAYNNWQYYNTSPEIDYFNDRYFIFEPGVNLEINLFKFFKIAGGASYVVTDAIDLYMTPNDVLDGFRINLSLIIITQ